MYKYFNLHGLSSIMLMEQVHLAKLKTNNYLYPILHEMAINENHELTSTGMNEKH